MVGADAAAFATLISFPSSDTAAIQTPDRSFGAEDFVLYIQLLGYMLEDLTKVRVVVADPHTNLTPSSRSSDLEDWSMVRDELLDLRQLHDLHTLDYRFHVSPLVV